MDRRRLVIVGAAGRDFHNFNLVYRGREEYEVVAFTATQIPNIDGRRYPAELAGHLYPAGIPIHPESQLEELVREHDVDEVVFSYSDVTHEHVMHIGSRVLAAGASYSLLSPHRTMLTSSRPVVAVCAVRTGSGKSQTTRHIAKLLRDDGKRVAVLRHPMPYGDLTKQAVQRFADYADLDAAETTIEEREEYEPHIAEGNVVFAGIDYAAILDEAEQEADVILWDGGNNDTPFIKPNLHVVVVDPHRAGHELRYHPGETNLRMAHVCVVNKVDTAPPDGVEAVLDSIRKVNPEAKIVLAASPFLLEENGETVAGKRVLAIEDGPTLTHGEMAYGAAVLAAKANGAAELVDPRPFAVGSIAKTLEEYPHVTELLPAMGYGRKQMDELKETIARSDAEVVLIGTPIDLRRVIDFDKPALRVTYRLQELGEPTLADLLADRGLTTGNAEPAVA
jgi:predicted GTPase